MIYLLSPTIPGLIPSAPSISSTHCSNSFLVWTITSVLCLSVAAIARAVNVLPQPGLALMMIEPCVLANSTAFIWDSLRELLNLNSGNASNGNDVRLSTTSAPSGIKSVLPEGIENTFSAGLV